MKISHRHLFFVIYSLLATSIIVVTFLPHQFFGLITFGGLYPGCHVQISKIQFTVPGEKVLQAVVSDEHGGDLHRNKSSYPTVTVSFTLFLPRRVVVSTDQCSVSVSVLFFFFHFRF